MEERDQARQGVCMWGVVVVIKGLPRKPHVSGVSFMAFWIFQKGC